MLGYFGLKQMYGDVKKKDIFGVLVTLFAVNHFILFFFVFQTFKHHTMALRLSDNAHGFVTFVCIQFFKQSVIHLYHPELIKCKLLYYGDVL